MEKKNLEQLMARKREINSKLGELDNIIQTRELNDEEKTLQGKLNAEYQTLNREISLGLQEKQAAALEQKQEVDVNVELREFFKTAKPGKIFNMPMKRSAMSTSGTVDYVQGITVVDLINTERKDGDIMVAAGVPMTVGVTGNKIQWAFAGGVEAAFANELAETTERTIDLDKQVPVQQRLTVRVRISNQALENSSYDLQGYIVKQVAESIKTKINFAIASTTKATNIFYGPFAQDTETGTYGASGYVAGKQAGTYTTFSKATAAEMISKLAERNISLDNVCFVMGAADYWTLKVTPIDAGSGIMLIDNDGKMLGIPVVVNNAINKATQTGAVDGHNIGLGNFKYLPVMQHGNIRLSVDASSAVASSTDEVITTINADFSMTILKDGADAFVLYAQSE